MSIRPIDFQTGVTRSTETTRLNNSENARPDLQQHVFAKEADKKLEIEHSQVVQSSKSDFNKVNEDGKGKNQYQKNKKEQNKKEDNKKEPAPGNRKDSSSMFDISI